MGWPFIVAQSRISYLRRMPRPARFDHPSEVIRPFVWVALGAFAAGYWLYLALS